MSQRLSKYTKGLLDKAQDSATQAVATYNDPRSSFRTGNFVVLMCIAWTSMLHAYFETKRIKYYYKQENGRYVKVDGEKLQFTLKEPFEAVILLSKTGKWYRLWSDFQTLYTRQGFEASIS